MGFERRPKHVETARLARDTEVLSAMGRKGAEVRQKNRELTEDRAEVEAELAAERAAREERDRQTEANEHIISPDGDDFDYVEQ